MGEDRSGSRAEGGVRPLITPPAVKPQPDRLYGRQTGHTLRTRQRRLIEATLPRLRFPAAMAGDPRAAFVPPPAELWLEIGFGGGEHALAQIAAHPQAGLIACEVFEPGLCSLLARLVPEGGEADAPLPGNLRLWDDDARALIQALPDACLDRVFLLFPDPWPKARHAKRRFVHPANIAGLARVLKPGGEWRVASDDPTYQAWVSEMLAGQDAFDAPAPAAARPQAWPPTRYEAKALAAGRRPLYWSLTRR
ncbi:MAG: tRNA (guanosine(46)-N7)-methyltransferase TrmB [Rhodospirillales bacterium]|nr:tRNA (guanine(46)-N(7))-methyltransferase TrmB [Rhodospirillales bacterium]MDE2198676.1 tRNA (guanosine(46)-N7)-methyltransferase TrmB [Rhodospirillales bacterium]MDE2574695.1 tRNA (guanosine(46)-N7)-methyltransferase TrmB [Rhodospirillales bacterium]